MSVIAQLRPFGGRCIIIPVKTHTLRRRDALLPLGAMAITFIGFVVMGHADFGWLFGMTLALILAVAMIFREGRHSPRFYAALSLLLVVHGVIFALVVRAWPQLPAKALSPIFVPDFIAMAYLFPKLTGLVFEDE